MRITDFNLDNARHLIKGWKFDRHGSTSRTAIFKRGKYRRVIIRANRRIVLCPYLNRLCGKDTKLHYQVEWILKHITDPIERLFALKFAFGQETLDENDINLDGDILFDDFEEYTRATTGTSLYVGSSAAFRSIKRAWIDWDITDIPASTITDVDLVIQVTQAYGESDTVRICSFDGTQINVTNYPDDATGNANLYNDIAGKTELIAAAADFQSTGSKSIDLGETADAKLQANLGVDFWSIGFRGSNESEDWVRAIFDSAEGTTPPNLIVTYDPC